jgi:hypothetical protein
VKTLSKGTNPVKTLSMIVIATLFSTAAYAGDNESPIRGKGPFSVVRNTPSAVQTGYTSEQINRSLEWLGRPEHEQIGHARVLYDEGAAVKKSEITIRSK